MAIRKKAQVAYAMIEFAEGKLAPKNWAAALRDALSPGTWVERYGRRWYIAQWNESADRRWIYGRLAFESAIERPTIWDAERKDVRVLPQTLMQVVPYVVDCNERRVAFELRSQSVRPGAFQGNLQALLGRSGLPWRIRLEGVPQPPWEEWRASRVQKLTAVWLSLTPPNPHSPLEELEDLFDHGVQSAQFVARGSDIELEGPELLREAFHHAQNYGKVSAEAVVTDGSKERWKSDEEEGGVLKDDAERDTSGQVPISVLQRLLLRRARATSGNGTESK